MMNMRRTFGKNERGAITMFLSLFMLLLMTTMVTAAYMISTTNLRAVGNIQAREEARAAAQLIIDLEMGGPFYETPQQLLAQEVDIDGDLDVDYLVDLSEPECVRAAVAASAAISSVSLQGMTTSSAFNTIWEFVANVTDIRSGASITLVQGVRVLLNESQKAISCP